jgi:Zn-dependent M28 family amino/carboxypeptidase
VTLTPTTQRLLFYGSLALLMLGAVRYTTAMPGDSYALPLQPPSALVRDAGDELSAHVSRLAEVIGERRVGQGDSLADARDYLVSELRKLSGSRPIELTFEDLGADGSEAKNIIFELPGQTPEIVLVGAHYDSAPDTRGANDNASGVAVALVLAKRLTGRPLLRSVRLVFFANEEPPYFQNPGMGSLAHARGCKERGDPIVAMLALESLGYYSDSAGSQRYPWPVGLFYPDRGNFVGFVANLQSRSLVREAIGVFRAAAEFPSEGAALPGWIPGVGWSDHWSFWQFGYPAIMITDTAVFRDPNYHQQSDVIENLSYDEMARVALGIEQVVTSLAGRL